MLVAAAAQQWSVDPVQCRAESGFVMHAASRRRAGFGELAARAATMPVPANPPLKNPKDYRIVGTSRPRVDIPSKVDGSAQFGLDVRLPGMLFASVIRPPVFGGKVRSIDAADAKAIAGVIDVVQFENGIAIIGSDTWTTLKARRALKVEWDAGPNAGANSADIRRQFTELAGVPGKSGTGRTECRRRRRGARGGADVDRRGLRTAVRVARADGADELHRARSHGRPATYGRRRRRQRGLQTFAAQVAGLNPVAVRVHVTMVGGGFGRRSHTDFVDDAVRLSKRMGVPVKVMWTREDDMQHDFYRPFGIHRLTGAVDADGWPLVWTHRVVTQPALGPGGPNFNGDAVGGAADLPYAIPNLRVEGINASSPVPVAAWRSIGHSQNGFVTESFLDELAAAGKKDPVELRRRLLANSPRHLGVLELAAAKAGWGTPMPAGSGRGVAVHAMTGSYVAQVAEVTIVKNAIRVDRVVCAMDCGIVINPDTLAAQLEGAIIFGLTCALKGEITIAGGRVEQDNFDTYPMLRMNEAPRVESHFVRSTEAPGGAGEPGVPPIAAAVANAVYAATGRRIRKLPLRLA